MCIAISLPKEYQIFHDKVSVPVVIETLLYFSDRREVLISFDCIVQNFSTEPVDIWLTHPDNVEGRLGTEDWYSFNSAEPDPRASLVWSTHDGCWDFDPLTGLLRYQDPVESYPSSRNRVDSFSTVARALTYRKGENVGSVSQVNSDFIDLQSQPFSPPDRENSAAIYRLLSFPISGRSEGPNCQALPFTTFKIGPIEPSREGIATAFRLTIVIADDSYTRLVQPREGSAFYVYSSDRILDVVEGIALRRFQRDRRADEYQSFFGSEIANTIIAPERYQIIIGQPSENDRHRNCVLVQPTSSQIRERVISDPGVRRRALWFNAWSSDFSMALKYGHHDSEDFEGFRVRQRPAVAEADIT